MIMNTTNTMPRFGRVLTAMATPFYADGTVDYDQAARLARYLIDHGNNGLIVAGSTGESVTLTTDEKLTLFHAVKEAVGADAQILGGVGSPGTAETIALIERAASTNLDGLLVVTPAYNKPSQEGLFQHFAAVAHATDLPVMLYNVPGRTHVNMEPATVVRLSEIANIVALKEAGPLLQIGELASVNLPDFDIYCGSDEYNLPALSLGAVGCVSVIGHIVGPDLRLMHDAFFAADMEQARRRHLRTLPITKAMFSVPNPVPVKTALAMMHVLTNSVVRLPLICATDSERDAIRRALQNYGLPVG